MNGAGVTEEKANTPPWRWRWRGLGMSTNEPIHFLRETVPFTFSTSSFPTLACESLPSKKQPWLLPKIALGGVGTLMWWTFAWMIFSLSLKSDTNKADSFGAFANSAVSWTWVYLHCLSKTVRFCQTMPFSVPALPLRDIFTQHSLIKEQGFFWE